MNVFTSQSTSGITYTPPRWAADILDEHHIVRAPLQIDPAQFLREDAQLVTLTANAAAAAVSIAVTALVNPIPSGTYLDFTGTGKFARTSAVAAAGATTISVVALDAALTSGDTAQYAGDSTKSLKIPSGTPIGRTFTERAAGTNFGPAVNTDDEFFLTLRDIPDANFDPRIEGYRPGAQVFENFLPNWTNAGIWTANMKTKLRATYQTLLGI